MLHSIIDDSSNEHDKDCRGPAHRSSCASGGLRYRSNAYTYSDGHSGSDGYVCTHAYARANGYAYTRANGYAAANCHTRSHTNTHPGADGHVYTHAHTRTDGYAHAYSGANRHAYAHRGAYGYTHTSARASGSGPASVH